MQKDPFVILLPPSEGKAEGGDPKKKWNPYSGSFGKAFGADRQDIIDALASQKGGSATLLGVSGKHLARAQAANRSLTTSGTLPAWQRYTGVVWDHLDLNSFTAAQRNAALARIVIPSGLAGLVSAHDPLPDYRLKMGARLSPFGQLARWWREDLTAAFEEFLNGRTVIDLLPQEHRAAFDWSVLSNVVRVELVAKKGGAVGGHNAKAAKGLLARHVLLTKGNKIAPMVSSFQHSDYIAKVAL